MTGNEFSTLVQLPHNSNSKMRSDKEKKQSTKETHLQTELHKHANQILFLFCIADRKQEGTGNGK
jgi:hypothetical protein